MSRTFADPDMLVWEAYPSGGAHGFSVDPYIVFNCLTNRMTRPRVVDHKGDAADAERAITEASAGELLAMFQRSREID